VASILSRSGHSVGLYTSPHLCDFRERIQVAGIPISEATLIAAARRLWPVIEREEASFFEATTALAFLCFAESGVERAVIEVGLGGRLDATNVVVPDVVVLTNVEIDHIDYLGGGLEEIAREKAGIIKPGIPVVTGERAAGVLEILQRRADEMAAPFHRFDGSGLTALSVTGTVTYFQLDTEAWGSLELRTPLVGAYQAWNTGVAIRALEVLPPEHRPGRDAVVGGVAGVHWPGRLQWEWIEDQSWIFDVAHNPSGVAALVGALSALPVPRPIVAVVGIMGDKDWGGILGGLLEIVDHLILTEPPSAPANRRWDPDRAKESLPGGDAQVVRDFVEALETARAMARGGTVLVTGSFHTVGDALLELNIPPCASAADLPPTVADG
jgi:dihydrofolate synthase/folylpolyglutamate synthase